MKNARIVALLALAGCARPMSEQCTDLATAMCDWAYRCPNSGYTYLYLGNSEEECVSLFGFSGAPAAGCENVTSESQACSSPETWHASELDGCIDEINSAACTSAGPATGTHCGNLCQ